MGFVLDVGGRGRLREGHFLSLVLFGRGCLRGETPFFGGCFERGRAWVFERGDTLSFGCCLAVVAWVFERGELPCFGVVWTWESMGV